MHPTLQNILKSTMLFSGLSMPVVSGALWSQAAAQSPTNPPSSNGANVYYCKSRDFNLPFNVSNMGRTPTELELEVSLDGGMTWQIAERTRAEARAFRYQANADGYYQFRLQIVESSGKRTLTSDAPIQIIIDSQSPVGELTVDVNNQGELVANFLIQEANLLLDSVRLEYRTEHDDRWLKIETALQEGNTPSEIRGSGVWDVPIGTHQLVVRLIARDNAGNELESFRYPQLPRTAQLGGAMQLASQQRPGVPSGDPKQGPAGNASVSPLNNPSSPLNNPSSPLNNPSSPLNNPRYLGSKTAVGTGSGAMAPSIMAPSIMVTPQSLSTRQNVPPGILTKIDKQPPEEVLPTPVPVSTQSQDGTVFELPPANGETAPASPSSPNTDTPTSLGNIPESSFVFKKSPSDTEQLVTPMRHPLGIEPFYSNSRTFSLDYDLESNPAIGIQSIELWGTVDQGKTWENWGADPDRASPMDVAVEEDGTFGFRIVTISDNGVATNRPIAGDMADVWIEVDSQSPAVKILAAQYGRGADAGSLVIEYQASDTFMVEGPMSLSISETSAGPWTTVATGHPNNGRMVWLAQPGLPRQVYLKLEALDRAGNMGEHRFDLPVDIGALSPRGKIQGIRPIRKVP